MIKDINIDKLELRPKFDGWNKLPPMYDADAEAQEC